MAGLGPLPATRRPGPTNMSRKQYLSILDSTARINIWHGAVRSGKTIASLVAFLMAVASAPSVGLIMITGRTLDTIGRNVMEPITDPALFGKLTDAIKWTPGAKTAVIFGRVIHLVGAADVRAEGKIRGATVCLIYVDEATLIPRDFFKQLLIRMSVKGARMFATTNPDNPNHWLKKEYIDRRGEADFNLRSWQFNLDDNPSLDDDYVRALKVENVGLWYRRFILGDWVQAEGAVYDMWDPDKHVVSEMPLISRWVSLGVDYGTTNPYSANLLGAGVDGRLYLANEWRWDSAAKNQKLTDVEYSQRTRSWLEKVPVPNTHFLGVRPEWWILDPSAASYRVQLHHDGVTARLADNEVIPGIRTLSSLLVSDLLRVHNSCAGFIKEMSSYSWDPVASASGHDAPIKADDHSLDAGRYAIQTTRQLWQPLLREPLLTIAA